MIDPRKVSINRLATGVPGLDTVLGGGLPEYSFNLIAGAPGTGKTTLEGQQLRSSTDIRTAAEAARRQHRTDAGRDQFFRRARARATRIMLANWPSVTAVAEALLEHGALDGEEVDRLMQSATHPRARRPG
jgi:predicted ATP-dependent serine protease